MSKTLRSQVLVKCDKRSLLNGLSIPAMISMEAVITLQKKPVSWIMEAVINSSKLLVVCNHRVIADRNGHIEYRGGRIDKVRVQCSEVETEYCRKSDKEEGEDANGLKLHKEE
ncbi:hypothetical protein DY000_02051231 [Brassica cretica]|uniref:Uncharacterized protein n=1 Tax=Brassica cretica TaxID=69181 RepID=A0ABQ7EYC0_BRACR|nr:hypothetical protein DY000_02051231 [Brassica cretica]